MPENDFKDTGELAGLEQRIGYSFGDPSLLAHALTHGSASRPESPDNERLEFLGDSVVALSVTEHVFKNYPELEEGELTEIKSFVVSAPVLARAARKLGLAEFARLGKGMPKGEALPESVHANLFEALVAAVYLDGGLAAAREFVLARLRGHVELVATDGSANFKAELQHLASVRFGQLPVYRLVSERGPDHHKTFVVEVALGGRIFPPAPGANKKEAEMRAARAALEIIRQEGF